MEDKTKGWIFITLIVFDLFFILILIVVHNNNWQKFEDSLRIEKPYFTGEIKFEKLSGIYPKIYREKGLLLRDIDLLDIPENQRRAFIYGYILSYQNQNKIDFSNKGVVVELHSIKVKRIYTVENFPLEDDCLNENHCFVRYEYNNQKESEVKE